MEEPRFTWRNALSFVLTAALFWLLARASHLDIAAGLGDAPRQVIHVALTPAPPAPPAPKLSPKPPPQPQPKTSAQRQQSQHPPQETSPHSDAPITASPQPSASANTMAVATSAARSEPTPSGGDPSLLAAYEARVREAVDRQKAYPASADALARKASGTVVISFVLTRSGELRDVHVEQSAGRLLDAAALASVRRASFPPFPRTLFPGQEEHVFSVDVYLHPQ